MTVIAMVLDNQHLVCFSTTHELEGIFAPNCDVSILTAANLHQLTRHSLLLLKGVCK